MKRRSPAVRRSPLWFAARDFVRAYWQPFLSAVSAVVVTALVLLNCFLILVL